MSERVEQLKSELEQLGDDERVELAYFLIRSLDPADQDAEAAWDTELARRLADIESGNAVGNPAAQVFAELRAKYV